MSPNFLIEMASTCSAEEQASLVLAWERGRQSLFMYLGLKMRCWREFPLLLCGVAHSQLANRQICSC